MEIHTGNLDPSMKRDIIHVKIILSLLNPQPSVFPFICREIHLRHATIVSVVVIRMIVSGKNLEGVQGAYHWPGNGAGEACPNPIDPWHRFDVVLVGLSSRSTRRRTRGGLLRRRWDVGDHACRRRSVVEERSIPVFGEFVHLQLEIMHDTLGLLALALQLARRLRDGSDESILALLRLGDERDLPHATLPVEVRFVEPFGEGVVDLRDALGDVVVDGGKPQLELVVAVDEAILELAVGFLEPFSIWVFCSAKRRFISSRRSFDSGFMAPRLRVKRV
ncbi:unnamed protein product [Miscanthus lutarioriparius]|uniref:Uncharacterized protein n=1 Tax=Miscanthus lutarioriparius TaxID=422564 RepID=A0A811RHX2_9POAL|nr:unnamed protein product [Miscanthus lutarioriparius]